MCVVSNVGDDWSRREKWPDWPTQIPFPDRSPAIIPENTIYNLKLENVKLRIQVEQMKRELEEARRQDIREGNADCEMEEKVIILKKIAALFGIELKEIFPND